MKNLKYITLCLAAFLVVASSCKKEEDETKPYMLGNVTSDFPSYVQLGTTVTAKAWGVTYPEEVTWKWYASSMTEDTLTCNPVTVTVPDSLGQFGIYFGAYKLDYYASTSTALFNTIDTAGTDTFYGPKRSSTTFRDNRDGFVYDIITVGDYQWFAQNLAWAGAGVPYKNSKILDKFFGRFYTWEEATTACPEGWRLPNNDEWTNLACAITGQPLTFGDEESWIGVGEALTVKAYFIDEPMWEYWPDNEHTNTVGWNGIPMGYYLKNSDAFVNFGLYCFFWSASEASADKAYYRYVFEQTDTMPYASSNRNDLSLSVRCVRNK